MLELGRDRPPSCIAACVEAVKASDIDLVFCCGPADAAALWEALSAGQAGAAMPRARRCSKPQAVAAIRAGDVIMVKGSLGSKMKTIVNALEKRFPGKAALDEAAV